MSERGQDRAFAYSDPKSGVREDPRLIQFLFNLSGRNQHDIRNR
jgi:hypothetical protein